MPAPSGLFQSRFVIGCYGDDVTNRDRREARKFPIPKEGDVHFEGVESCNLAWLQDCQAWSMPRRAQGSRTQRRSVLGWGL